MGVKTEYSEKMKMASKLLYEDEFYDFEPKSIWDYKKYTSFDKKITDKIASDGLKEDYKKGKNIKEWVKVGGGQRALSKFNSENCKNIINFFTSKGDIILDPFAGRTRATISNHLGRKYVGFELTEKYFPQTIGEDLRVYNDDSANMGKWLDYLDYADLVFTCPPYWDMEKYSDDSNDLSTFKTYDKFLDGCNSRLELASQYLKEDGFLVVVLMDFRKKGILHSWHTDTINYFHNNTDFKLYDTMVWEMSPAKRQPLYPQALLNRRMLNTHEYCLVFNRKTQTELRDFYDRKLEEDMNISEKNKTNSFWV
tara:strand:- start:201 stop:1130 length:930 start_codon:yes stop_codon:yes gene_type:complete